jgi:hypothetical protein
MFVRSLLKPLENRSLESEMIRIVPRVQTRLVAKCPEALNPMQIGRVGWQEPQLDPEPRCQTVPQCPSLLAGLVEPDCERHAWMGPGEQPE